MTTALYASREGNDGLVVENASVAFGPRIGLRDLSFRARSGERLALLGPSGVGKTSLLRAIAGLDSLAAGRVFVHGRDVTHVAAEQRGVVYLHQSPSLFPHLSVIDNVGFPLEVRGLSRSAARERASVLLERVQLHGMAMRAPSALSGGQRHRVALARALAAEPRVLLLDEPFASLDPALRGEVRDAVFALLGDRRGAAAEVTALQLPASNGQTTADSATGTAPVVVLITHDIDEAVSLSDRLLVLLDGTIAQDDGATRVVRYPRTVDVARFLGVPNIIRGALVASGSVRSPIGDVKPVNMGNARGSVWLLARPDAIRVKRPMADGTESAERYVRGVVTEVRERISGATVQVRCGDTLVIGVIDETHALAVGDRVIVTPDLSRIHCVLDNVTPHAALPDALLSRTIAPDHPTDV